MVYVGIDIGTTCLKAVAICGSGETVCTLESDTPHKKCDNIEYFDLSKIHQITDDFITQIQHKYKIDALSFTSVGESVVPIKNGMALSDPIIWFDPCTSRLYHNIKHDVERLLPPKQYGNVSSYSLSLFKILWMQENLNIIPDLWLPISSWLCYRLGGKAAWAESQACRSFMVDVYQQTWSKALLDHYGLSGKLPPILHTGHNLGVSKQGFHLALSGHDHPTSLFGLSYLFSEHQNIVCDSMGTSARISALIEPSGDCQQIFAPSENISIAMGFNHNQYCFNKGIRYFGKIFEQLMIVAQQPDIEKLHRQMGISETPPLIPLLAVGGDDLLGKNTQGIMIWSDKLSFNETSILQAIYGYYAYIAALSKESLLKLTSKPFIWIAAGGPTKNKEMLRWKASAINQEIYVIDHKQVAALGAACAAMVGMGDHQALDKLKDAVCWETALPDPYIQGQLKPLFKQYNHFKQTLKGDQ